MTQPSLRMDPAPLVAVAQDMDRVGHDLGAVDRGLQPYAQGDQAVLGEYGAAVAWTQLLDLWTHEVRIASRAAHEWSASLRQSIDNYEHSDGDSAQRLSQN